MIIDHNNQPTLTSEMVCLFSFFTDLALPPSPPVKAGTPSDQDLLDVSNEFSNSWKLFCRVLKLSEAKLAQIEEKEPDLPSKCHGIVTDLLCLNKLTDQSQCLALVCVEKKIARDKLASRLMSRSRH